MDSQAFGKQPLSCTTHDCPSVIVCGAGELARARVAVIGDVMLGRFMHGDVERISPEAPIPVLRVKHTRAMLGGAGNVASLGAHLLNCRIDLVSRNDRPTVVKTRVIAQHQQVIRLDSELIRPLAPEEAQEILSPLQDALQEVDVLLLSDYGKGVLMGEMAENIISLARDAGKPAIVDPKGRDYNRYRGTSLITPNLRDYKTRQASRWKRTMTLLTPAAL
jgi:D-beta-D-heptose 7-phosphate kinase / D-beta-D-heptose 1-phosphate adenosyltransferase